MWLEGFYSDLRYSARALRRSPAFTAAAILSLALGIGANTAIFSLLDAVLLRLVPVRNPGELVQFTYTAPQSVSDGWNSFFDYPHLERFRAESKTLGGIVGGTRVGRVNVAFDGASALAQADACTDNFFSLLGIVPEQGRFFAEGEDRAGEQVAVLSDRYFRSQFGGDPAVVGRTVAVNQIPFAVIGVAPADFFGLAVGYGPDIWVPLHALDRLKPDPKRWTEPFTRWLTIAGRMRRGMPMAHAQAELDSIHRAVLRDELPGLELRGRESIEQFARESHLVLRPAGTGLLSGLRDRYAVPLKLLLGVAGVVLLAACANLASLMLVRATKRRREIAVRLALGASRARLARQLLTESVLLASLGGALALGMASKASAALVSMISTGDTPVPLDPRPDWRVFGFAAAVTLISAVLFGLAPALRATHEGPAAAIKESGRLAGRSPRSLDRLLVVAQVAFSGVLVIGAGLFVRTLEKLWDENTGYARENVLMFSVDTKLAGYPDEKAGAVYRAIFDRLRTLGGVESASASVVRPVDDQFYLVDQIHEIDGRELSGREAIQVAWNAVSPGYFHTVSTPILLGRDFDMRDGEDAPAVAIVNESLARRAFPGQSALGRRLGPARVVGIVKDSLYAGMRGEVRPVVYYPLFQHGRQQEFKWGFVSFVLRHAPRANLLDLVRHEVASVDRNLPVFRVRSLSAQMAQSLLKERLLAILSSFFGALALILTCVGLYGTIACGVARRTGEIGVRMALGAQRGHIVRMVLGEAAGLTLAGLAGGVPPALGAARFAKSQLFGIGLADPWAITAAVALLAGVTALAAFLPARRAAHLDAMEALRHE